MVSRHLHRLCAERQRERRSLVPRLRLIHVIRTQEVSPLASRDSTSTGAVLYLSELSNLMFMTVYRNARPGGMADRRTIHGSGRERIPAPTARPQPNNWFVRGQLCQAEVVSSEPESDEARGAVLEVRSSVRSGYVDGY